ncbi:MAG: hypothetical protein Q8907_00240 [Bacteroidota bacterium]|nr:hypothetical protein [Bacteroidota bacterium]
MDHLTFIDEEINEVALMIQKERKALKNKRRELSKRVHIQLELFPIPAKPAFIFPTLFEIKNDISEPNMNRIFNPIHQRIFYLQTELKKLQNLKVKMQEAEKSQLSFL